MKRHPHPFSNATFGNRAIASMYARVNHEYHPQTNGVVGLAPEEFEDETDGVKLDEQEEA